MNKSPSNPNQSPAKVWRPRYDEAFNRSAIEDYRCGHGGALLRSAQQLGIHHWASRDWVRAEPAKQAPPPPARTLSEAETAIARLQARAPEQRDIPEGSLGILLHT
jgi:hypothetical protein